MQVIHSIWDTERFYIWAESSELAQAYLNSVELRDEPKSKREPGHHPFAFLDNELYWLPEIFEGISLKTRIITLRLPSNKKGPLPSPWLLLDNPITDKASFITDWTVDALVFDPGIASDLLIDLPTSPPSGLAFAASLLFWSDLAMFTLELISREQFVPAVRADEVHWEAVISDEDSERLDSLLESMPPSCRGFQIGDGKPPSLQDLILSFINSMVDSFIRSSLQSTSLLPSHRGRKPRILPLTHQFLQALSLDNADKAVLKAPAVELKPFTKEMQSWLSQIQPPAEDAPFRTSFRLEPPVGGNGDETWTVRFFLQARDDRSLLVPAVEVWRTRSQALTFLKRRLKNPQEQLLSDLGKATRIFPQLEKSLQMARPISLELETEEAYSFLRQFAPLLEQNGFGVLLPTWWEKPSTRLGIKLKLKSPGPVSTSIGQSLFGLNSLIDYDWELAMGDETISEAEFIQLARLKVPLVLLRGEWVELPIEEIEKAIEFFKKHKGKDVTLGEALKLGLVGGGAASAINETNLEGKTGLPIVGVEAVGWIDDLLKSLSGPGKMKLKRIKTPQGFNGSLRPYQAKGVSWLEYLNSFGLGACLADDMGLGKTIELIAFLLREREGARQGSTGKGKEKGKGSSMGPTLLICPMSVAGNWQRELEHFSPSLKVMLHHGMGRLSGDQFKDEASKHDMVITTYSLAQRDEDILSAIQWEHIVLDEAQNIKNQSARQTQAIKRLKSGPRIALTGTPVENRLSELWSIMDFLNPDYLGSAKSFRRDFVLPIEKYRSKERSDVLKRMIQPFVLRRLKTDPKIISDLPEKMEMKVNYNLTPEQASLYAAVVDEMLGKIEVSEGIERKGQILSALTKLKEICDHPALFLQDGSALPGRSGKLIRLEEMLYEVMAAGEKALIFTQFAGMGAMLRHHLQEQLGSEVLFLHGGTPKKQRDAMIQRFQSGESGGVPFFVLSLKAGGLGLNLTAANHVFHFDRWWNPAVENQATDRTFRIGQKKNVFVHKFVCLGTLEERIDKMIEDKKALAESVIGTGEAWLTEMSNDALRDLLTLRKDAIRDGGD